MGGHYLRVIGCARRLMRDPTYFMWNVPSVAPSADSTAFHHEMVDFMVCNRGSDERHVRQQAGCGRRSKSFQGLAR
eukprot:2124464-Lingulodinium_polyedra.AAC.1